MATDQSVLDRLAKIEKRLDARDAQQITFPLDPKSVTILNKFFLSHIGNLTFENSSGINFRNLLLKQDGRTQVVNAWDSLCRYTANATSNVITITQDIVNLGKTAFSDGQQVIVLTTGTPPSPLVDNTPYYVRDAAGDGFSFKLSATFGGAAINLTDTGVGEQYIYVFS